MILFKLNPMMQLGSILLYAPLKNAQVKISAKTGLYDKQTYKGEYIGHFHLNMAILNLSFRY